MTLKWKGRYRLLAMVLAALATSTVLGLAPAPAHSGSETISLHTPLSDGDSSFTRKVGDWAVFPGTQPSVHPIVYSNWGSFNDWSVDIFGPSGRAVVSPIGSKTSDGHAVQVSVVGRVAGCASGLISDGGWRVTVEAKDTVTGAVIGRADLMHVDNPQVSVGQVIGPRTVIGYLKQFAYSNCYQVWTAAGVHLHLEVINRHNYACYIPRASGGDLTELTVIGKMGTHDETGQRASC